MKCELYVAMAVMLCAFMAPLASAEVYRVSDLGRLAELLQNKAEPGDVIEIAPGTYYLDASKISVQRSGSPEKPIIIRGVMTDGKRPVIDASKYNVKRGIFAFEEGTHDVVLENLELRYAAGGGRANGKEYSRNAAACYILGHNITIRNCHIHHCENGLFSTHESDYVLVENCQIGFNGREKGVGEPHRTHGFYFNSNRQMVKNCYIHNSTDAENFKSRGHNTIFAFNRVEEELAYSLGVDSGNSENTLWLGNVVVKRTYEGINQGRLLGVGDGTGVATGTLVALNNTFITIFPRDFYLFTFKSSTTDVILINNVFAGPGTVFMESSGKGAITGANNWIQKGIGPLPEGLENTIFGDDARFVDAAGFDFRLKKGSPLADAGVSKERYMEAVRLVTAHTRGEGAGPSVEYSRALEEIERSLPAFEPAGKGGGATGARKAAGALDVGAYEYVGK